MFAALIKAQLQSLSLLLPALVPSWRFFDIIAPSPRIEFALLQSAEDVSADWQEFRPRPPFLPFSVMLKRMFYNPSWNEQLYMASCAERLVTNPTEHSLLEIRDRIKAELCPKTDLSFKFRLVFVSRQGLQLAKEVVFVSAAYRCDENVSS